MNLGWRTGLSPGKPLLLIHKNAINYDRIRDRTDVPAAVFDRDLAVMARFQIPFRDLVDFSGSSLHTGCKSITLSIFSTL